MIRLIVAIAIFFNCFLSLQAKAIQIPHALQSVTVKELSGTKGVAESVKLWTLGNRDNINYIWIIFHGDSPKFYTDELAGDRLKLHKKLLSQNKGAILIQPKSLPSRAFGVMAGQGWADIYGRGQAAQKMTLRRKEFGSMIVKIFRQFEKRLKNRSLKLQTVSFSGSGRIDRAFHEFLLWGYDQDNNDLLRVKELINNNLYSVAACDSMVNNSFDDASQKPLVKSWVSFLKSFPRVKTTLIHDQERTYPYMADMIQEILQKYTQSKVTLPMRATRYNNRLKVTSGKGHMGTFIGMLDQVLFW